MTILQVHIHFIVCTCMCMLMRDMKKAEGRKKQARSNEQQGKATQHTQGSHFSKEKCAASGGTQTHDTLHSRHTYTVNCTCLVRDAKRRKEEGSKHVQTNNKAIKLKQNSTYKAVKSCLRWDSNPRHSTLYEDV